MYVAVKGGEKAIDNAHRLLAEARRGDPAVPEISLDQIGQQLSLAVDRVMPKAGVQLAGAPPLLLHLRQHLLRLFLALLRRRGIGPAEPISHNGGGAPHAALLHDGAHLLRRLEGRLRPDGGLGDLSGCPERLRDDPARTRPTVVTRRLTLTGATAGRVRRADFSPPDSPPCDNTTNFTHPNRGYFYFIQTYCIATIDFL